jgi:hypothetical protein
MDQPVKEAIEIRLHLNNINRETDSNLAKYGTPPPAY